MWPFTTAPHTSCHGLRCKPLSSGQEKSAESHKNCSKHRQQAVCLRRAKKTAADLDNVKVKQDSRCLTLRQEVRLPKKQDWKSERHFITLYFCIHNGCRCTGCRMTDTLLYTCAVPDILQRHYWECATLFLFLPTKKNKTHFKQKLENNQIVHVLQMILHLLG